MTVTRSQPVFIGFSCVFGRSQIAVCDRRDGHSGEMLWVARRRSPVQLSVSPTPVRLFSQLVMLNCWLRPSRNGHAVSKGMGRPLHAPQFTRMERQVCERPKFLWHDKA